MITGFINGLTAYVGSFFKLGRYGLGKYLIITLLIGVMMGWGLHYIISVFAEPIENIIQTFIPFEYGSSFIENYLSWFIKLILYLVTFFIYKYIILIILGPILSIISNKIEKTLSGFEKPSSIFSLPKELMRGVGISFICLIKELKYTIPLFALSFIPVFGLLPLVLLFFVQAYFFALGCFDYFAERYYSIRETLEVGRRNKWELIGVGSGANLTLMIPFIGVMFAPILATIATTELAVKGKME
jgi:CysZ protein